MESQNIMGTKKTLPLLLSMSLPVVLSMLIQALYNIVDSLWVTRLGTDALTAVSLAFPLQNIIMSAGVGMGIGISFLLSTISLVACGVFEALGRGRTSLVISMLRQLVVLVPVGMVLSHFWGAVGIWLAFPIAEAVTLVPALGRMRQLERELG